MGIFRVKPWPPSSGDLEKDAFRFECAASSIIEFMELSERGPIPGYTLKTRRSTAQPDTILILEKTPYSLADFSSAREHDTSKGKFVEKVEPRKRARRGRRR